MYRPTVVILPLTAFGSILIHNSAVSEASALLWPDALRDVCGLPSAGETGGHKESGSREAHQVEDQLQHQLQHQHLL